MTDALWTRMHPDGLVLRTWEPPEQGGRVVACVILKSDDLELLVERAPTWRAGVDGLVAVLGAWSRREPPRQAELASRQLLEWWPDADVVMPPAGGWRDQVEKRSAYLARLKAGEVGFVVDADETLEEDPALLRREAARAFDVGWVTISARPRYERPYGQPRLFRVPPEGLGYRDRHYWVFDGNGRLFAAHSYGGPGRLHARLALTLVNKGGIKKGGHVRQFEAEARHVHGPLDDAKDRLEPLRIVQVMRYDAGLAAYRLHSAINATTRERSVMVSDQGDNPLAGPWLVDLRDRGAARSAVAGADVVHCHVSYEGLTQAGGARGVPLVIHHHGSVYRADPARWDHMDERAALRLGSTMDVLLHDATGTIRWLPNPVPVELYRRMARAARERRGSDGEVWVAHSPSKPKKKGTAELQAVVDRLRAKGLKLRLVLTAGVPHAEALWQKAACDLCFDSFWLGIQVSGLEAAAMGMPVVAGDLDTAARYSKEFGAVPYTFAGDERALEEQLERLATDPEYRWREALRVGDYVLGWHDEAAVAKRYLELLREALSGRGARALQQRLREHVAEERRALAQALRPKVKVEKVGPGFRLGRKINPL